MISKYLLLHGLSISGKKLYFLNFIGLIVSLFANFCCFLELLLEDLGVVTFRRIFLGIALAKILFVSTFTLIFTGGRSFILSLNIVKLRWAAVPFNS